MNGTIRRRAAARRDLVTTYRYYARETGPAVANRFLEAAEATFDRLARMPGLGTYWDQGNPARLGDLRYFPIQRFRKYLVFYLPVPGGIEVVRILHGARDITGILADDFDLGEDTGDDDEATA